MRAGSETMLFHEHFLTTETGNPRARDWCQPGKPTTTSYFSVVFPGKPTSPPEAPARATFRRHRDDDAPRGVHPHREHASRGSRGRAIVRRESPRVQRRPSPRGFAIGLIRHLRGPRRCAAARPPRRRAPPRLARVAPDLPSQRAHRAPARRRRRARLVRRRALRRGRHRRGARLG